MKHQWKTAASPDVREESDASQPVGYRRRMLRFVSRIGAEQLGGSVYELDPGDSVCPYHYECVEEEWLFVLTGRPALRDPEGEHELAEGDAVCSRRVPQAPTR